MIRYRRLNEGDNPDLGDYVYQPDLKLYDVINYADHEWYIIDMDDDIVTLLAKNDDFGESEFSTKSDRDSDDYKVSMIRKFLNWRVSLELKISGANLIPTRLEDVGCSDKVWLLSSEESKKLPKDVLKFDNWWWLRSRAYYRYGINGIRAAYVSKQGAVTDYGSDVTDESLSVRPAIRVPMKYLI